MGYNVGRQQEKQRANHINSDRPAAAWNIALHYIPAKHPTDKYGKLNGTPIRQNTGISTDKASPSTTKSSSRRIRSQWAASPGNRISNTGKPARATSRPNNQTSG